jgi:hypothetical protein
MFMTELPQLNGRDWTTAAALAFVTLRRYYSRLADEVGFRPLFFLGSNGQD